VFESLWKRREELMITSLRHYLFTSSRYMIIRYFSHREVKRRFAQHYQLFEAVYESMDKDLQRDPQDIYAALLQHIHDLPDRCQEAIRLRITENLSNGEIARRMNINKGTVQLYISRAFAHLRGFSGNIFKPAE
jgi:RNA polymerase sigma-70 factor (ECF subfamily)